MWNWWRRMSKCGRAWLDFWCIFITGLIMVAYGAEGAFVLRYPYGRKDWVQVGVGGAFVLLMWFGAALVMFAAFDRLRDIRNDEQG